MAKKFKALEKNATATPTGEKEITWEGEEVTAESTTKLQDDKGTGQPIILRFFDFAANPEIFKQHRPTAQQLFDSHIMGIKALLWRDSLQPVENVEPRLLFSKDKKYYRFAVTCTAGIGSLLVERPQTLSELLV